MTEEIKEGWGVIRPGDRRAHFYRGMFSLCRRVGFYNGPLEPDAFHSPQDCKECRRTLTREAVKADKIERAHGSDQGGEGFEHVAEGVEASRAEGTIHRKDER